MSLLSHITSYLVRPRIKHLILHVTDRCNLHCGHCFVERTHAHTLPVPKAKELAKELASFLWLDISGGEPFILDELPDLISPFACEVLGIPTKGQYPERTATLMTEILFE